MPERATFALQALMAGALAATDASWSSFLTKVGSPPALAKTTRPARNWWNEASHFLHTARRRGSVLGRTLSPMIEVAIEPYASRSISPPAQATQSPFSIAGSPADDTFVAPPRWGGPEGAAAAVSRAVDVLAPL